MNYKESRVKKSKLFTKLIRLTRGNRLAIWEPGSKTVLLSSRQGPSLLIYHQRESIWGTCSVWSYTCPQTCKPRSYPRKTRNIFAISLSERIISFLLHQIHVCFYPTPPPLFLLSLLWSCLLLSVRLESLLLRLRPLSSESENLSPPRCRSLSSPKITDGSGPVAIQRSCRKK